MVQRPRSQRYLLILRAVRKLQQEAGIAFHSDIYREVKEAFSSRNAFNVYVRRLVDGGFLERLGFGVYRLTQKGVILLELRDEHEAGREVQAEEA